jgi:N-dimethylarginine dimethylaminohydrolase
MAAVSILRAEGVDIVEIDPDPALPYQFNIRDAVFVVANRLFLARMRRSIRAAEPAHAARHVAELGANHLDGGTIEGGDVLVDDPFVFVGLSDRTSRPGVASLARQLKSEGLEVVAVPLTRGTLHLDTVLCCMPDRYLVDARRLATPADTLTVLGRRRPCHVVDPAEAENFATNVLLINEETVLAASGNARLASTLRSDGFRVIEVDMRAHHRIGGSVRCMTAPLRREPKVRP